MHNSARWRPAGLATVAMTGLAALGAFAAPVAAHAQGSSWPGRIEILSVRSRTLPLDAFLRGDKAGPDAFCEVCLHAAGKMMRPQRLLSRHSWRKLRMPA